jgi:hypothetical protein
MMDIENGAAVNITLSFGLAGKRCKQVAAWEGE